MQNPIHSAGTSRVPMDERSAVWKSGKSNEAPIRKRNPLVSLPLRRKESFSDFLSGLRVVL